MITVRMLAPLFALFFSCGNGDIYDAYEVTSKVTFFNESSYSVSVHHSHFSGLALVEKLSPGSTFSTELSPSNNYGVGDVFSIRYWHLVASGAELACGDVWTSNIDPNMQITQNIEIGQNYIIHIPNPSKFELQEAFIKILNASEMPIQFNYLGNFFTQAGNSELHVHSGKTGVYRIEADRTGETQIKGYTITQGYFEDPYPFPELSVKNGYMYSFEFNGELVKQINEEKIVL